MSPTQTRDVLLDTAKALIWERGLAATSPNLLLDRSGLGKGSLYHFFPSKTSWARAAIASLAADLLTETERLFAEAPTGATALAQYLGAPRPALAGCRLGRLAFDPAVMDDADLRRPIDDYFGALRRLLFAALGDAGIGADDAARADVAEAICAVVQGGYVTARLRDDPGALAAACRGLAALLGLPPGDPDERHQSNERRDHR